MMAVVGQSVAAPSVASPALVPASESAEYTVLQAGGEGKKVLLAVVSISGDVVRVAIPGRAAEDLREQGLLG